MIHLTPASSDIPSPGRKSSVQRYPASKFGVIVVRDLIADIVTGVFEPGGSLPPEAALCERFGVSRTVVRESVKRLEEKNLIAVEQGRGTYVLPSNVWNVLDPVVLSALVENDENLRVLDELTSVRCELEGMMSALTAMHRTDEDLDRLGTALEAMRDSLDDETRFNEADAAFHFAVMTASGNQLAQSITHILFRRARESGNYTVRPSPGDLELSYKEHSDVFTAIVRRDAESARSKMRSHITDAWVRRRGN